MIPIYGHIRFEKGIFEELNIFLVIKAKSGNNEEEKKTKTKA